MKGQMSLEMVIGLLILLVVAAVVINLFLGNIKSISGVKKYQDDLRYRDYKATCESSCNEYLGGSSGAVARFCTTHLSLTKPNTVPIIITNPEAGVLPVCEDAIYCFHTYDCKTENGGVVTPEFCRQSLCAAWISVYNNAADASQKIRELVPSIGSCSGIKDKENWWKRAGFGPDLPCGGATG